MKGAFFLSSCKFFSDLFYKCVKYVSRFWHGRKNTLSPAFQMFSEDLGFGRLAAAREVLMSAWRRTACPAAGASLSISATRSMLFFLIALCRGHPEQGMSCTGNWTEAWLRRGFSLNKKQGRDHYLCVQQGRAFTFILLHPHRLQKESKGVVSKQDLVMFWFFFPVSPYQYYPSGSFWMLENRHETSPGLLKYWVLLFLDSTAPPSAFFTSSSLMWATRRATLGGWGRMFPSHLLLKLNFSSSCYNFQPQRLVVGKGFLHRSYFFV